MKTEAPKNVEAYIAGFPPDIQKKLKQIRSAIKKEAPGAEETILYAMPAYVYHGHLVFFAAYKNHIGFYPIPAGDKTFQEEVAAYRKNRSTLQFPLDKALPLDLIAKTVRLRVLENTHSVSPGK